MGHDRLSYDTDAGMSLHVTHDGANEARGMREAGRDTGATASRDDGVMQTHAFAPGEDDERLAGEHSPGDRATFGEGMRGGHHDAKTLLVEHDGAEAEGLVGHDWPSDRGGKPAFGDHFPNALRSAFFQVDSDARVALSILAQETSKKGLGRRPDITQAQLAFFAGGSAANAPHGFLPLFQQERAFPKEHGPRRGETDVMAGAFEHGGPEGAFQLLDGAAQGGLSDAKAPGSAGVAQVLRDGLEVSEVAQFHVRRYNSTASRR